MSAQPLQVSRTRLLDCAVMLCLLWSRAVAGFAVRVKHADTSRLQASHNISGGANSSVVGVHYKVGKKIGEGSFGVIFEGPSSKLVQRLRAPDARRRPL